MPLARIPRRPLVAVVLLLAAAAFVGHTWPSSAAVPARADTSATCAEHPNQAAAQRAADTRDPDGDGVYCESLPCPCAGPTTSPKSPPAPTVPAPSQRSCQRPTGIQVVPMLAAGALVAGHPGDSAHNRLA